MKNVFKWSESSAFAWDFSPIFSVCDILPRTFHTPNCLRVVRPKVAWDSNNGNLGHNHRKTTTFPVKQNRKDSIELDWNLMPLNLHHSPRVHKVHTIYTQGTANDTSWLIVSCSHWIANKLDDQIDHNHCTRPNPLLQVFSYSPTRRLNKNHSIWMGKLLKTWWFHHFLHQRKKLLFFFFPQTVVNLLRKRVNKIWI